MSFNAKDMTQGGQLAFMRLRLFVRIGYVDFQRTPYFNSKCPVILYLDVELTLY
nr:hypothetical protein [Serratia nematodiphila]